MKQRPTMVLKIGGSLYDLPYLKTRLLYWIDEWHLAHLILVPGGGATVDAIRTLDHLHQLGEERAHWLALRSMSVAAWFLADLFPQFQVSDVLSMSDEAPARWILDAPAFAQKDEGRPGSIPHCWSATSDTLAARVAEVINADELVLFKSIEVTSAMSWQEAAQLGHVDPLFPSWVLRGRYTVRVINLRDPE